MSVQELRSEIDNVLLQFGQKELEVALKLLKQLKQDPNQALELVEQLQRIFTEDNNLLKRLAQ